ncbi:unnamed protein product [Vitrella brassicaformis CCMP3155]|uniref:Uncharacterized protein n=3 Tax=Vitrella brassicaformis TaxID=1169539 RepID=A0A0G4GH68_VITBC|nr:unnamed protein product [Vitrella brassicaformis CCMP3155]|eukprot:CEM28816.1 unnamed protein product [Vitrella brassicaformis CCMP3155]
MDGAAARGGGEADQDDFFTPNSSNTNSHADPASPARNGLAAAADADADEDDVRVDPVDAAPPNVPPPPLTQHTAAGAQRYLTVTADDSLQGALSADGHGADGASSGRRPTARSEVAAWSRRAEKGGESGEDEEESEESQEEEEEEEEEPDDDEDEDYEEEEEEEEESNRSSVGPSAPRGRTPPAEEEYGSYATEKDSEDGEQDHQHEHRRPTDQGEEQEGEGEGEGEGVGVEGDSDLAAMAAVAEVDELEKVARREARRSVYPPVQCVPRQRRRTMMALSGGPSPAASPAAANHNHIGMGMGMGMGMDEEGDEDESDEDDDDLPLPILKPLRKSIYAPKEGEPDPDGDEDEPVEGEDYEAEEGEQEQGGRADRAGTGGGDGDDESELSDFDLEGLAHNAHADEEEEEEEDDYHGQPLWGNRDEHQQQQQQQRQQKKEEVPNVAAEGVFESAPPVHAPTPSISPEDDEQLEQLAKEYANRHSPSSRQQGGESDGVDQGGRKAERASAASVIDLTGDDGHDASTPTPADMPDPHVADVFGGDGHTNGPHPIPLPPDRPSSSRPHQHTHTTNTDEADQLFGPEDDDDLAAMSASTPPPNRKNRQQTHQPEEEEDDYEPGRDIFARPEPVAAGGGGAGDAGGGRGGRNGRAGKGSAVADEEEESDEEEEEGGGRKGRRGGVGVVGRARSDRSRDFIVVDDDEGEGEGEGEEEEEEEEDEGDEEEEISDESGGIANGDDQKAPYPELHGFEFDPDEDQYALDGGGSEPTKLSQEWTFFIDKDIYGRLKVYQVKGVKWMWDNFNNGRGCILADEMGLGKTVQTLAFLGGLGESNLAKTALVILTTSLLTSKDNWTKEFPIWCPKWKVYTFHGSHQEKHKALRGMFASGNRGKRLLVTTYDTFKESAQYLTKANIGMLDVGEGREALTVSENSRAVPWDVVILDEASKAIKNPGTQRSKAINTICRASQDEKTQFRLLLTGTPIENNLKEFWSLMNFAEPGLLGNQKTFETDYWKPIERGAPSDARPLEKAQAEALLTSLRSRIKRHMLRRTTKDLEAEDRQAMPTKHDVVVWHRLSKQQLHLYGMYLQGSEMNDAKAFKQGAGDHYSKVLKAVTKLQKVCMHPFMMLLKEDVMRQPWRLALAERRGEEVDPEAMDEFGRWAEGAIQKGRKPDEDDKGEDDIDEEEDGSARERRKQMDDEICQYIYDLDQTPEAVLSYSEKLQTVQKILQQHKANGHRTLVFSRSTTLLDLLEYAVLLPSSIKYLRIDGSVSAKKRAERQERFKTKRKYKCMLLTTRSGGHGLNLVSADRVIIMDPDWNPSADDQAVDRINRYGQKAPVVVAYRLMATGGIEDKMFRRQVHKAGINKAALERPKQMRYFTKDETKNLIHNIEEPDSAATKKVLDAANEANPEAVNTLNAALEEDLGDPAQLNAIAFSDLSLLYANLAKAEDEVERQRQQAEQLARMKERQMDEEPYQPQASLPSATKSNKTPKKQKKRIIVGSKSPRGGAGGGGGGLVGGKGGQPHN